MKILVACEQSGIVRDAFIAKGHDAISCDILPSARPGPHHQGDLVAFIHSRKWDRIIAFPPCTFLCSSGLHWNNRGRGYEKTEQAIEFVRMILDADCPQIALENPLGCISTRIRKYSQIIQPYQFGHNASKSTCLWLKGLPLLSPTKYIHPRIVGGKKRWANQTDSGQNKLAPSPDRARLRSETYQGIADAMAEQWV